MNGWRLKFADTSYAEPLGQISKENTTHSVLVSKNGGWQCLMGDADICKIDVSAGTCDFRSDQMGWIMWLGKGKKKEKKRERKPMWVVACFYGTKTKSFLVAKKICISVLFLSSFTPYILSYDFDFVGPTEETREDKSHSLHQK